MNMILVCEDRTEFVNLMKKLNIDDEKDMHSLFLNVDYSTEHFYDIVIYMINCRNMQSSDYIYELDDMSTYPAEVNRNIKKFLDVILT